MRREDIKSIIEFTKKNGGNYTCTYIPGSELTPENCNSLYYGGASEIRINATGFSVRHEYVTFKDYADSIVYSSENGEEKAIDRIYEILKDNIGAELHQAMSNLEWEYEELKYFDRDTGQFEKFKNEINKLRRDKKLNELV